VNATNAMEKADRISHRELFNCINMLTTYCG